MKHPKYTIAYLLTIRPRIQAASINVGMLVAGRLVAGLSIGIASSVVPIYQAEIAPKEIRGRVVSLQQWAITWGILIQFFIQYGCSFGKSTKYRLVPEARTNENLVGGGPNNPTQSTAAFRIPWAVQITPAVILFIGLFWFPKSPRWLASKDRWDEALKVLADLHGNGDINHPKVLAEYTEIEEQLRFEREEQVSNFRELLKPKIAKRVFLGMSVQMWSQLSGMNVLSECPTKTCSYDVSSKYFKCITSFMFFNQLVSQIHCCRLPSSILLIL